MKSKKYLTKSCAEAGDVKDKIYFKLKRLADKHEDKFLKIALMRYPEQKVDLKNQTCPHCHNNWETHKAKFPILNPIGSVKYTLWKTETIWTFWCQCGKSFCKSEINTGYPFYPSLGRHVLNKWRDRRPNKWGRKIRRELWEQDNHE